MPTVGTSNLPVAPRDTKWDAAGARKRIFALYETNVAGISRAFLWREPVADARTPDAYALCFCDVIDGRLMIVPRGVAIAAGGRGVGGLSGVSDEDKATIRARITSIYDRIRKDISDWPESPFAVAITADAAGDEFEGPIAFEAETTGDKRRINRGALRWEDGPWPLIFDRAETDHSGATVGTINEILREGRSIVVRGAFSESEDPETQAAVNRARELFAEGAVGVSILTDDDEFEERNGVDVMLAGRIRHVAIVDTPAFSRARLSLVVAEDSEDALVAAVKADPSWFANPNFGQPSPEHDPRLVWQTSERAEEVPSWGAPWTVTDDGQVFGHFALFDKCHIGYEGTCLRPPKEPKAYENFMTGSRLPGIPSGVITMRTAHAPLSQSATAAADHYANTGLGVADVHVGADKFGLWAAGALRPDASQEDIEILRASALSGDWRNIGGQLRLVGLLAVNSPGFRIARAMAASGSLITNGPGCDECNDVPLEDRIAELERIVAALSA